uniref:pro-sigmaK processing inhibitor BofA family protein n=1 Tax=Ndongobacter massiliensis TaxID=1871025 RepID=UPI0009320132|nr:pro-sigmaK processing inhibitor BofA family protein [Ndongobacter massiliensis]
MPMALVFGAVGLLLLWGIAALFKLSMKVFWKLLVNGLMGLMLLFISNLVFGLVGLKPIEIQPLTAILTGFFGLPYILIRLLLSL